LDFHAALRRRDDAHPLLAPVQHESQIDFALDGGRFLDVDAVHDLPGGAGLVRDEPPAQQLSGRQAHFMFAGAQLHAAGLAAGARMDLCLHDPPGAADLLGAKHGLFGRVGHAAARDRHAEVREQLLGLIFMDIHAILGESGAPPRSGYRAPMASASSTMFAAMRADAASIMRPSSCAAPRPCDSASRSATWMRRARSTSAPEGVNSSLAMSICVG